MLGGNVVGSGRTVAQSATLGEYTCSPSNGMESFDLVPTARTPAGCMAQNSLGAGANWDLHCAPEEACNSLGCFAVTLTSSDAGLASIKWTMQTVTITCYVTQAAPNG